MDMTELHSKIRLNAYSGVPLDDARGRIVTCVAGTAWLTMEGDSRDIVLASGESFTVDRDGLTLVAAQVPSTIVVSRKSTARGWWASVVDFLDHNFGPAAVRADTRGIY